MVHTCKMISPGCYIPWALWGVKGQKIAPNEKRQLHMSRIISQEQHSLWL